MMLAATTFGHGPDLALLHGWGLGAAVWKDVAEKLAADFRVHLLSLPGYDDMPDDNADFAATADALAATLPAGTLCCGWSMGGMLALAAANRHPGHFGRLALVGSTARFVRDEDWPHAQTAELLDTFRAAVAADTRATLSRFIMLFNQGDAKVRALSRALAQQLAGNLPAAATLLRGLDWLATADLRPALATLDLPVLLLHGDNDPLMPIGAAEALVETIPGARLERFPACAHAPFVAAPDAFVDALRRFSHESA
jgi:pimeloyl-[acyl-carrier protein] methyl ester esterase